jgi:hypothetical protein
MFSQKIPQFSYLKTILFFVWVSISEERKENLRKPYLRVLVRIAGSLYSEGGTPASGSASSSASGYESTVSPIINLN